MLVLSPSQLPRLPRGYLDRLFYLEALEAARERSEALAPRGSDPKVPEPLRRSASRLASEFRKENGVIDRPTAERISRLLKSGITRRRKVGPKPNSATVKAAKLLRQGVPWKLIYHEVIPGYSEMSKHAIKAVRATAGEEADKLRRNARLHLKKTGIRSPVRPGRPKKATTETKTLHQ